MAFNRVLIYLRLLSESDLLLLPGRGGMVISESLSVLTPVLCFACDGSEYDLLSSPALSTIALDFF